MAAMTRNLALIAAIFSLLNAILLLHRIRVEQQTLKPREIP